MPAWMPIRNLRWWLPAHPTPSLATVSALLRNPEPHSPHGGRRSPASAVAGESNRPVAVDLAAATAPREISVNYLRIRAVEDYLGDLIPRTTLR